MALYIPMAGSRFHFTSGPRKGATTRRSPSENVKREDGIPDAAAPKKPAKRPRPSSPERG